MKILCFALVLLLLPGHSDAANKQAAVVQKFVISEFAVPVAVPVAPFSPYFYGYDQFKQPDIKAETQATDHRTQATDISARVDRIERLLEQLVNGKEAQLHKTNIPERANPALTAHCIKCHSGETPRHNIRLDQPLDDATARLAFEAVLEGRMPKSKKLAANQVGDVLLELSKYRSPSSGAQAPPEPEGE